MLKNRFKTLTQQLEYSFVVQVKLLKALCCLHNIIRLVGGDDIFDEEWIVKTHKNQSKIISDNYVSQKEITIAEVLKKAKAKRSEIAQRMWRNYCKKYRST